MKAKNKTGEIYTPDDMVELMLDELGYVPTRDLSQKYFLDNSCGDGNIVVHAAKRYIESYWNFHDKRHFNKWDLVKDIREHLIFTEINRESFDRCVYRLNELLTELIYGNGGAVYSFDWFNSKCCDALACHDLDGKIDFLCANPPYVRIHDVGDADALREYKFCGDGMTDMYLAFVELGLRQLSSPYGRMTYLTPNSWFTSEAGETMRKELLKGHLHRVLNFGHRQVFENATTYVTVFTCTKTPKSVVVPDFEDIKFGYANVERCDDLSRIASCDTDVKTYGDVTFDETKKMYFMDEWFRPLFAEIMAGEDYAYGKFPKTFSVKNGFATLADDIFIKDSSEDFGFESNMYPCIKASTAQIRTMIFPYNRDGTPIDRTSFFRNDRIREYFNAHKDELLKGGSEHENPEWHLFGRTQAIKDIGRPKMAIGTLMSEDGAVKVSFAHRYVGVYSGLYVTASNDALIEKVPFCLSKECCHDAFVRFVKALGKYKSGGYYTFSSKDLEKYLNWCAVKHMFWEKLET